MYSTMFRSLVGAVIIGALLMFAILHYIGAGGNGGRLTVAASHEPASEAAAPAPLPSSKVDYVEPTPEATLPDDSWYEEELADDDAPEAAPDLVPSGFAPEPMMESDPMLDPIPQAANEELGDWAD